MFGKEIDMSVDATREALPTAPAGAGDKSVQETPETRPPQSVDEGARIINEHMEVLSRRDHFAHDRWVLPWVPKLLVLNKKGAYVPSHSGSRFVPDKKGMKARFAQLIATRGFDLNSPPASIKEVSWERRQTALREAEEMVATIKAYKGSELTGIGGGKATLYLTETTYEPRVIQGGATGNGESETIYRMYRLDSDPNGSTLEIPPGSPSGLHWSMPPARV